MLITILHDHRTINIATAIAVIISGLYASYSGLLGRPSGFLRQLLVGIPLGIIVGIFAYFTDANKTFSTILKELIQSPAISISSITIGFLGFLSGLSIALIVPNFMRTEKERRPEEWEELSISTLCLMFPFYLFLSTLWGSVGILTLFQLLKPWLHFHPPLLGSIAAAFLFSMILFFGVIAQSARNRAVSPTILLISPILYIPQISIIIYVILALRWTLLEYFVILCIAVTPVMAIQYAADRLDEKRLQIISLVFFVVAAALQLYQAIAL